MATHIVDVPEYNLILIRGIPQNPTFDLKVYEDIVDNFETNNGDTFVTTYVKAGTTWTQQIIHLLVRGGEPGGNYGETVPWLESLSSPFLADREAPTWTLDALKRVQTPRYFKSHATVDQLPRGHADIKVIYVARNPKDTVVSLYHHARNKPEFGYNGSFGTFLELFLAGEVENGSWFDHVLGWHKECMVSNATFFLFNFYKVYALSSQEHPDSHVFVMYEDIYEQPMLAVQLFAEFLGLRASDAVYEAVVRHSQLEEMRAAASIGMQHLRRGTVLLRMSACLPHFLACMHAC
jgi:hypothetical protein